MFTSQIVFTYVLYSALSLTLAIMSYAAFGHATADMVIFNLPTNAGYTIVAQILYILTTMGSFCIMMFPVFMMFEKEETSLGSLETYSKEEIKNESNQI